MIITTDRKELHDFSMMLMERIIERIGVYDDIYHAYGVDKNGVPVYMMYEDPVDELFCDRRHDHFNI